jgi:ribosomal subunit interface protein
MAIEITVRHVKVSQDAKDYVGRKAEEITVEFPSVENVHVIMDASGYRHTAEFIVQGKHHLRVEASSVADGMIQAIDSAAEKTVNQLRKAMTKVQDHRQKGA